MSKYLTFTIETFGRFAKDDLNICYIIADTIEERGIGEVIEEGIGESHLEITIRVKSIRIAKQKMQSLLFMLDLSERAEIHSVII